MTNELVWNGKFLWSNLQIFQDVLNFLKDLFEHVDEPEIEICEQITSSWTEEVSAKTYAQSLQEEIE